MSYQRDFEKFIQGRFHVSAPSVWKYAQAVDRVADRTSGGSEAAYINPMIIEERKLNAVSMDVFSRLMMDRIIFLGVPIDSDVSNIVQAQLLFLESLDNQKDINLYINSPGGVVYSGLAIYDTMQYVGSDVQTICTGIAASMAAVLLCAGVGGKRHALRHSRVMIHQPMGGAQGQVTDMEITLREVQKLKSDLIDILVEHSGQPRDRVAADSERDFWMNAQEAKEYGMIDEVIVGGAASRAGAKEEGKNK